MAIALEISGVGRTVDFDLDMPLLWMLRDVLGMTGTKYGCWGNSEQSSVSAFGCKPCA